MTGSRLVLALLTAKQILGSLSPNDYFLIIKVHALCDRNMQWMSMTGVCSIDGYVNFVEAYLKLRAL